ncbi:MAG: PEGA domain-containing protein [Sandaracinaceae bacterium]
MHVLVVPRPPRLVPSLLVAVLLSGVLAPDVARADDASEAQLQDELGRELYAQGRYREALEHFLASNRLVPNPNVMANIGSTYQVLRRYVEAFNWFEAALAAGLTGSARQGIERARSQIQRRVAVVDVQVSPETATIYIDRIELGSVGEGPRLYAVAPGSRLVIARAEGHRDAQGEVRARRGEVVELALSLEPILGQLRVTSDPPGAVIRRASDGEVLGETPLTVDLPPGGTDLRIEADGYQPATQRVRIQDGETTEVRVELTPDTGRFAVLTVNGRPEVADVLLDDELLGEAPLTRDRLTPGRYELRVRADGRDDWVGAVVLEAGSASRVDYQLRNPNGGPSPWWFIVGYSTTVALFGSALGTGIAAANANDSFFTNPSAGQLDRVARLNTATDALWISGAVLGATTLIIDLVTGHSPPSRASITLDR